MVDDSAVLTKLSVKVVPGASKSGISGWLGDALKIRVAAQPERGKANEAVVVLLAATLGLPKNSVAVASGQTSQKKVVEVRGLSMTQIKRMLAAGDP